MAIVIGTCSQKLMRLIATHHLTTTTIHIPKLTWNIGPLLHLNTRGKTCLPPTRFAGLAYYQGKYIVFRFIIEYNSLRDFGT
jgi:hypothetical protein